MNKFDEEYYRVDFDTAKLLKEAQFNEPCYAFYLSSGYYFNQSYYKRNKDYQSYIASPLIAIALEWVKEKGYEFAYRGDGVAVFHNRTWIKVSTKETGDTRQDHLNFIANCCTHLNKA